MMYIRALILSVFGFGYSVAAQAGFMDMLGQAAQVAGAVRGQPAAPAPVPTQPPATQPTVVSTEVMQQYAAMDCTALRGLEMTFQQQLAATSSSATAQVGKAAGFLSRASGLLGAAGALAGVDTKAIQQAAEMSQQANQVANGVAPLETTTPQAANLAGQLSAIGLQLQAKSCP